MCKCKYSIQVKLKLSVNENDWQSLVATEPLHSLELVLWPLPQWKDIVPLLCDSKLVSWRDKVFLNVLKTHSKTLKTRSLSNIKVCINFSKYWLPSNMDLKKNKTKKIK